MATGVKDLEDTKQDDRFNPVINATPRSSTNGLSKREDDAFKGIADNYNQTADPGEENDNIAKAKELEKDGGWADNTTPSRNSEKSGKKQGFIGRVKSNKKKLSIIGIAGGGIGGIAIAMLFAFMPLKLEMMIQNITKSAASVPAYAVEQRTEFLITRALATRMMIAANGSGSLAAGQLAFCSGGAIGCSLFLTYTSDFFEKKMDMSFKSRTDGKVDLIVNSHGRERLGAKAKTWTIEVSRDMNGDGILKTVNEINSNKEMKAYLKKRVSNDMKTSNTMTRFLARRVLMKKHGVTQWRAFEKTQNKVADIQSSFKAGIFKNTVGKVSPRTAMYMGCLAGGEACAKLLKNYSTDAIDLEKIAAENEGGKDSKEYKAAVKQQETIGKINSGLSGEAPADGSKSLMSKFISSNVLKVAGGGLAVAGVLDLAFMAVHGIENGALEEIGYDMQKTAAIGYAFGDSTGIVTNNDKMKAGEVDIEAFGVMMSMFDGAEQSPVMSLENGRTPTLASLTSAYAANGQVTRSCETATGIAPVTLNPGESVCPERKMVRDYSSSFTNNAAWQALIPMSEIWMRTIHNGFEFVNGVLGEAISLIPGMDAVMAAAGDLAMPAIEWLMSLIFDVPPMGFETTGDNNYDSLSAGIHVSQNELMENGVGDDGKAFGGGGTVLAPAQVAMIQQDTLNAEQEFYNEQTVIAKIFNPRLKGSFAQNFIAMMPTSFNSLSLLPSAALATTISPVSAAPTATGVNPFGIPVYGYAPGDPILTADPSTYTAEQCANFAKAREESYGKHDGQLVATYNVADPCALEMMAVGNALEYAGVTDDDYSLPELSSLAGSNPSDSPSSPSGPGENSGNIRDDGWAWPTTKGATACGFSCYGGHTGMDIGAIDAPFYAARDGVVKIAGVDPYMNPALCWSLAGIPMNGPQYLVTIEHTINGQKTDTVYAHMPANSITVKPGDRVKAGDLIAKTGSTGCSSGVHGHFAIYVGGFPNGTPIDPTTIFTSEDYVRVGGY